MIRPLPRPNNLLAFASTYLSSGYLTSSSAAHSPISLSGPFIPSIDPRSSTLSFLGDKWDFIFSTKEEATSSHLVLKETTKVIEVLDSEEDFEAFDQPYSPESPGATFKHLHPTQVNSTQESSFVPDTIVLQRKPKTILLKLLESYAEGSVPEVTIQTRPPTPLPVHTSPSEPVDKRRKRDRKGKDVAEEGEVIPSKMLEPQKGAKIAKGTQKKSSSEGAIIERVPDCRPRVQI
nr:hypothetical protein CFP56_01893 [Quercus suber]